MNAVVNALVAALALGVLSEAQLGAQSGEPSRRAEGRPEFNRLVNEKSPYLLQHARNPVDWYPWGNAAFERAKKEGRATGATSWSTNRSRTRRSPRS